MTPGVPWSRIGWLLALAACSDSGGDPPAATTSPVTVVPVAPTTSASAAPDVVSAASPPVAGPAVKAHGTLDGNALRARNARRLRGDDSAVVALVGDDPVALGQRLCEAVVPTRSASVPVLLKPNIGGFDSIKSAEKSPDDDGITGRITNVELVRGVIRCLRARGHTEITVADGWAGGHSAWNKLVERSGYAAMAQEEGVALVCLCDDGHFDVHGDKPGLPVAVALGTGYTTTSLPHSAAWPIRAVALYQKTGTSPALAGVSSSPMLVVLP